MSTSGISGSGFSQLDTLLASAKQITADFKQLGSDLQSGNLSAAQQDFVTLSQDALASPFAASSTASSATSGITSTAAPASAAPTASASSTATAGSSPQSALSALAQDFQTLGQDLQSGNLSGAQQAFSQIQQAAQQATQSGATQSGGHHHRHHSHGSSSSGASSNGSSSGSASSASELQALLAALGTASNSGSASDTSASSASSSGASASGASASGGTSGTGASSTLENDFQNLGQALHDGDLSAAQQAFTQLTQAAQSPSRTHRQNYAENYADSSGSPLIQAGSSSLNISA